MYNNSNDNNDNTHNLKQALRVHLRGSPNHQLFSHRPIPRSLRSAV